VSAFKFRLARVLRVRRATEEIQRAKLAQAEAGACELETEALSRAESVRAAEASLRIEQAAPELDTGRILVGLDASARLEGLERSAHVRATTARSAAEVERSVWRDARADVLGLERLEDRERTRFRIDRDAREERVIEEVASRRAEEQRRQAARTRSAS
jgi:flagellar biosynthesis chaperone FliJ